MRIKMENLYEDLYSSIKHMLQLKKRNMGMNKVNRDRASASDDTVTSNSNYNDGKMNLDANFVRRLIQHLDLEISKSFPDQTKLKMALNIEVKKIVKTGNDKELKKVVDKIRDIVFRERMKFMDQVEKKVAKILVDKY